MVGGREAPRGPVLHAVTPASVSWSVPGEEQVPCLALCLVLSFSFITDLSGAEDEMICPKIPSARIRLFSHFSCPGALTVTPTTYPLGARAVLA